MAITYPTTLDTLTNPAAGDAMNSPSHATQHANANDILEALEAKVGVTGSTVATSIDYLLKNTTGGHDHDGSDSKLIVANLDTATGKVATAQIEDAAVTTALIANANVTSAKLALSRCKVYRSTVQEISHDTVTDIAWTAEVVDALGWHTGTSADITVSEAGDYLILCNVAWESNATGFRSVYILANGVEQCLATADANAATSTRQVLSAFAYGLSASQVIKAQVYQNSTGAVDIGSATDQIRDCSLSVIRIS